MIAIKKIKVVNFKSFEQLDVDLSDCNVVVGANSSGKSNFIECFTFLRNLERVGLAEAVSFSGGSDFFSNFASTNKPTRFEVKIDAPAKRLIKRQHGDEKAIGVASTELNYSIEFETKADEPKILFEEVVIKYDIWQLKKDKKKYFDDTKIDSFNLHITRGKTSQEIEYSAKNDNEIDLIIRTDKQIPFNLKELFVFEYKEQPNIPKKKTLIESPYFMPHTPWSFFGRAFDIKVFDFEPKAIKSSYIQTESDSLKRNGENIAMMLKIIAEDREKEKKFVNVLKQFLPYIENIKIESLMGKLVALEINEKYSKKKIPVSLLSDGTVNIICTIFAFFFDKSEVIIIEEPEKNVHPQLISLMAKMAEDVSKNKQIFLSTHNLDLVKNSDPKNIILITRNNNGISSVFRAIENKQFLAMLENNVEIADIFRSDIF